MLTLVTILGRANELERRKANLSAKSNLVYIVDDDLAVLDSLKVLLESVGINAATFDGGKKFLAEANLNSGGALVLDIDMPGTSGLNVLDRLAELKSNLAVIMISGRSEASAQAYAIKMGAVAVLEKPIQTELLVGSVRKALGAT